MDFEMIMSQKILVGRLHIMNKFIMNQIFSITWMFSNERENDRVTLKPAILIYKVSQQFPTRYEKGPSKNRSHLETL